MVATSEGDGTVSWAAGRFDNLPAERCWYMPVEHGALTATATYSRPSANCSSAARPRHSSGCRCRAASATWTYDAAPPSLPVEGGTRAQLHRQPAAAQTGAGREAQTRRGGAGRWTCASCNTRSSADTTSATRSQAPSGASTAAWWTARSPARAPRRLCRRDRQLGGGAAGAQ